MSWIVTKNLTTVRWTGDGCSSKQKHFFLSLPATVAASVSASFGGPGVICTLLDLHVNKSKK